MSDYDNAISCFPQKQSHSRRTTQGKTGFYTAGAAASPKKPTSPRAKTFSGVTATPKNVTASASGGKSRKPPTGNTNTVTPWRT